MHLYPVMSMDSDVASETGWHVVAEGEEVATIIDAVLRLDPGREYSRSELAEETDIPLKTLHLLDDVESVVDLGMLEKHDPEGGEVRFTVDTDSDVYAAAQAFGAAVRDQHIDF